MQQLYDELMRGTRKFKVNEDGTETFIDLPPTSKEIRAAKAIASLSNRIIFLENELKKAQEN